MKKSARKRKKPTQDVVCPECGGPLATLYTRPRVTVRFRRVACGKCGRRFTTIEKFVNRGGADSSTGRTAVAMSITDLLQTLGLTPADLLSPATLLPGDKPDDPPPTRSG